MIPTMELYSKIGKIYKKEQIAIERGIRYSIIKAYENEELKIIYKKRPSNRQFLNDLTINFDIFRRLK